MLTVSLDGEEPRRVKSVVLFDSGIPVAVGIENSESIIWADSVRDPVDLIGLLKTLGVVPTHLHRLAGSIGTDPGTAKPIWKQP